MRRTRFSEMLAGSAIVALALAAGAPREHVELVAAARHSFTLRLGGTLDGFNTRSPIGYAPWTQRFEPMRSVRLENVGEGDVVDPWLVVDARGPWRTAEEIAEAALRAYGEPASLSDAERARAVWEYQRQHRYHGSTGDHEPGDVVKLHNIYGYSLCEEEATALADLWRLVGLRVRRGFPSGHVTSEVGYDGAWHLLDSDTHGLYPTRDGSTLAGEEALVRDHDLVKRIHSYGILAASDRMRDEFVASLYTYTGRRNGEPASGRGHSMRFTLRPGEALEWRWDGGRKRRSAGAPDDAAPVANGRWIYAVPL
ncbi:MAG TPA: hypothetical protein VJS92_11235, partial [Candidatus Polarisedimenticolaceae bacterium]|nr:hypothetical protein [Candidatus Polarisedimenticolaceae bacterium]